VEPREFDIEPRPLDPLTGFWNMKVTIKDAVTKELQVRKDADILRDPGFDFSRIKVYTR
jgi:hypothetical protein